MYPSERKNARLGVHNNLQQHFMSRSHHPFMSPTHRSRPACAHTEAKCASSCVNSCEKPATSVAGKRPPTPSRPPRPPKMLPSMEARFFQHLFLTLHMMSVSDGQSAAQPEALLFDAPTPLICSQTAVGWVQS